MLLIANPRILNNIPYKKLIIFMTESNITPEEFQMQQMEVFGDLIEAFDKSAKLIKDLSDTLPLLNFTHNQNIQNFYDALVGYDVGISKIRNAFKYYSESHMLKLKEPELPIC